MKRSDFFIRLTTGVLFLAVAAYVGVYLYNMFVHTYVTTAAIRYSVEETLSAQGYIVRSEIVLSETGIAVLPIAGEGERVAAGQAVAVEYNSLAALEAASEIRSLRMQIEHLEAARSSNNSETFDAVIELSSAIHRHDFRRLDELSFNIESSLFAVQPDVETLIARLDSLESIDTGIKTIYSQTSGTFSHVVDGFEHIHPDMLYDMFPSDLSAYFETPYGGYGFGKLITSFRWYYAAIMDFESAALLSEGQTKTLQFLDNFNAEIEMTVENVGRREDGKAVVIFSSDRGIHNIAPLRALRADVVLGVFSGIRIPKEAIHLDDENNTFVFLETSGFAEQIAVEILITAGDSYIVRDNTQAGSPLRVDSTIIVRANNLYHGKTVP